jgi:hypothetical protein
MMLYDFGTVLYDLGTLDWKTNFGFLVDIGESCIFAD